MRILITFVIACAATGCNLVTPIPNEVDLFEVQKDTWSLTFALNLDPQAENIPNPAPTPGPDVSGCICKRDPAFPCLCGGPSKCACRAPQEHTVPFPPVVLPQSLEAAQLEALTNRMEGIEQRLDNPLAQDTGVQQEMQELRSLVGGMQAAVEGIGQRLDHPVTDMGGPNAAWWVQQLPPQCLVVATRKDCPPCRVISERVVSGLVKSHWNVVYIDVDASQELATYFKVTSTPEIIGIRDGAIVGRAGLPAKEAPEMLWKTVATWFQAGSAVNASGMLAPPGAPQ